MTDVMGRVTRRGAMGLLGTLGVGAIGTAVAPAVRIEGGIASAAADAGHAHEGALIAKAAPAAQSDDEPTADEMDAMHEAGVKAFPAADRGARRPAARRSRWTATSRSSISTCQVVQWEVDTRQAGRGLDLQRRHAGSGDPRHRGRQGPRHRHQRAAAEHRRPLARPDACRTAMDGVPVHHPAADQAGRDASPTSSRSARATPAPTCTTRTTTPPTR